MATDYHKQVTIKGLENVTNSFDQELTWELSNNVEPVHTIRLGTWVLWSGRGYADALDQWNDSLEMLELNGRVQVKKLLKDHSFVVQGNQEDFG